MPTNITKNRPTAIFFFAHQDDEFGVFDIIVSEQSKGNQVVCVYLTRGAQEWVEPTPRNNESLMVLGRFGVSDVFFVGDELMIPDLHLIHSLEIADKWIEDCLNSYTNIKALYVLAWEGGHPDHDALHALVVQNANRIGRLGDVRQFALYHSYRCPWQFFKVLSPLIGNGPSSANKIAFKNKLKFLSYLFVYRSQLKTWIGLFPFVFWHYLIYGIQELQNVSVSRIKERPHAGRLYYEKRRFSSWELVNEKISEWISKTST